MHAAPAVSVKLTPSRQWRAALLALGVLVVATTALWAWQRDDIPGWCVCLAVAAFAAHCVWHALRTPALALRWDGESWWLASPAMAAELSGDVAVALDLGAWLLLRFRAVPRLAGRPRHVWLPLQRAGLPAQWHALRCALYSPRPRASLPAAPDPSA
jgi:hypothetical protein